VRLDNLFGNREAKAGVIAELLLWSLRIEALEDFGESLFRDAGACIFDHDKHTVFALSRPNTNGIAIFAEGNCVADQVDEDLGDTGFKTCKNDRLLGQV